MKEFLFILFFTTLLFAEIPFPGRGVNLGNWLEAPKGSSLDGVSSWGIKIDSDDFVNIAQKGFKHLRIPMRFSDYLTSEKRVSPEFMTKVKWAVEQTIANGMIAIIDVHHFEEMNTNPEENFPVLKNIWEDISAEFKNYPDDKVLFELLNEPNDKLAIELWNTYPEQLIRIIRQTNPTRPILLGTADWGGFNTLKALKIPEDENLIITLHYYSPHHFTHQGAEWNEGADEWLGTRWTGTAAQQLVMKQEFQEVADYAKQKNLKIHIGEFGAYNKAPYNDRVLWTEYVARLCNHFGFAFSYWEYSAGFGLFNPQTQKWNEELAAAVFSAKNISDEGYTLGDINLVRNPNFENGAGYWSFWAHESGNATNAIASGGYSVTVTKIPSNTWEIQLLQSNIPLEAGKSYLLSFDVSGDEGMSLYANIQTNTTYANWGGTNVSVPAQNVKAIIQAQETNETVNLIFNFGYTTGKAVISNVSLKEMIIDNNTPISKPNENKNTVKKQKTFISKNIINAAPFSEFDIVSANGKVLFSGICDAHGKAKIKELPKGVYMINVKSAISLKYLQK